MNGEVPQNPAAAAKVLWNYSLAVYARAGFPEAALALQDGYGLDVNRLLWCLWAGLGEARELPAGTLQAAHAAVAPWQAHVIGPLRSARRWLKGAAHPQPDRVVALRRELAAVELAAEHAAQVLLAQCPLPPPGTATPLAAAAGNLRRYATAAGCAPGDPADALLAELLALAAGVALDAAREALAAT